MTRKQYFRPLDFSVQIAGWISTVNTDEKPPPSSAGLPIVKAAGTSWDMYIGVQAFKALQQVSTRPNIRLIRDVTDQERAGLGGAIDHINSERFRDPDFTKEFVLSVRTTLSQKLPKVLAEAVHYTLMSAFFDVAEKYDITG